MKILISAPTGYNAREILLPLQPYLTKDSEITSIIVLTPAAAYRETLFPTFSSKFTFVENPQSLEGHRQLLSRLMPDIVMTGTAGLDPFDVPILRAAQVLHVRTLTFVASWDNVYKMERRVKMSKYHGEWELADHLAVWNALNRDHLQRIFPELADERVTIIGAPRFDLFWHSQAVPTAAALRHYVGIANDARPLLHVATTELYPMEYVVKALAEYYGQRAHIYVSVHPGGDITRHQYLAERYGVTVRYSFGRRKTAPLENFRYLPTSEEMYMLVALFKYSAVLINHSSTVALESIVADVPVVNVKYGQAWDWWRWRRSMVYRDFQQHYRYLTEDGAPTVVKSAAQLLDSVEQALQHPEHLRAERRIAAAKLLTRLDGSASTALLNLIKEQVY